MGNSAVEELKKRIELKEIVDKTIESVAKKIQSDETMPESYAGTITALAELITARAELI